MSQEEGRRTSLFYPCLYSHPSVHRVPCLALVYISAKRKYVIAAGPQSKSYDSPQLPSLRITNVSYGSEYILSPLVAFYQYPKL